MKRRNEKLNERFRSLSLSKKVVLLIVLIVLFTASIILNNVITNNRRENQKKYQQQLEEQRTKEEPVSAPEEPETPAFSSRAYSTEYYAIPAEGETGGKEETAGIAEHEDQDGKTQEK